MTIEHREHAEEREGTLDEIVERDKLQVLG